MRGRGRKVGVLVIAAACAIDLVPATARASDPPPMRDGADPAPAMGPPAHAPSGAELPVGDPANARRPPDELGDVTGEIVVIYRPGATGTTATASAARTGAVVLRDRLSDGLALLRVDAGDVDATLDRLRADPAVLAASPNHRRHVLGAPLDPQYAGQAAQMDLIRAPLAWDRTRGARTIKVAIVDTGIDLDHPDLAPNILSATSLVGGSGGDVNGHGTAVAGVIAAVANNGIGISGVAPNVRLLSYRVTGADGIATDYNLLSGIAQARYDGADVINVSIGGFAPSDVNTWISSYLDEPNDREPIIIGAAGDDAGPFAVVPAAAPQVLAVGAVDNARHLSWTSNHGSWIDVVAPGVGVLSTKLAAGPTAAFERVSGTSFAAAYASGVAALAKTRLGPGATRTSMMALMRRTSRDLGAPGFDTSFGYGLVDAAAAAGAGIVPGSSSTIPGGDADSVPAGAVSFAGTTTGAISPETDVDWYRFDVPAATRTQVTVTPPAFLGTRTAEMDPRVELYDTQLRVVLDVDLGAAGEPEVVAWNATPGTHYLRITNFAGSESPGSYAIGVSSLGAYVKESWAAAQAVDSGAHGLVEVFDANGDGLDDVLEASARSGLPSEVWLRPQRPNHTLGPAEPMPFSPMVIWDADAGDLDGDGDEDLAIGGSDSVLVSLQVDGVLTTPVVAANGRPESLRVVDLDGDGVAEIIGSFGPQPVTVLTRGAGGTYTSQSTGAVVSSFDQSISAGDVDGDGFKEIILPGAGVQIVDRVDGTWTTRVVPTDPYDEIAGVATGDFDGDGDTDVMARPWRSSSFGELILFAQDDSGLLVEGRHRSTFRQEVLLAGDLDGDGDDDIVEANAGTARFHRQVGDDLLLWQDVTIPTDGTRYDSAWDIGDIDGDGMADVVVNGFGVPSTAIRHAAAVATPVQDDRAWVEDSSPRARAANVSVTANLTVTSGADIAPASVTEDNIFLLHGRTGEGLGATVTFDPAQDKITVNPDRALASGSGYALVIARVTTVTGDAVPLQIIPFATAAGPPPPVSVSGTSYLPVSTDFDANGGSDIFWYSPTVLDSEWDAWHDGFYSSGPYDGFRAGMRPVVGDFDGDTYGDFFAYFPGSAGDRMFLGRTFGDGYPYTPVNGTYTPLAGDFDADRKDDVLWYAPGTAADSIWYGGVHQAGFTRRRSTSIVGTYRPVVGDFDGDYDDDVMWYAPGAADSMWKGSATGFTSTPFTVAGSFQPFSGDFDGNGVDDIAWYTSAAGGDWIWSFLPGGGHTVRAGTMPAGGRPIVGDFDADQYDDVFWYAPGTAADRISWGSPAGLVSR